MSTYVLWIKMHSQKRYILEKERKKNDRFHFFSYGGPQIQWSSDMHTPALPSSFFLLCRAFSFSAEYFFSSLSHTFLLRVVHFLLCRLVFLLYRVVFLLCRALFFSAEQCRQEKKNSLAEQQCVYQSSIVLVAHRIFYLPERPLTRGPSCLQCLAQPSALPAHD